MQLDESFHKSGKSFGEYIMFGRAFVRFISLMIEENSNRQVAVSCVMGMCLGLFPILSLQWVFFLLLCMIFRFNLFSVITTGIFFQLVRSSLEPQLNDIGLHLLTQMPDLFPLWRWMYHAPVFPFLSFNNTVDLAGTLLAFVLSPFICLAAFVFLRRFRGTILNYWRATRIFRTYASYRYISK